MPPSRQFSEATYLGLKAACRDVVTACGGPQRAAALTRAHPGHLSEALSAHDALRFMAIDQVIDLEAESGLTAVTRFLADLAGLDLAPRQGLAKARPASLHESIARVVIETADVSAELMRAMADGRLSDGERATVTREIEQAIDALQTLKATVRPALKAVATEPGRE